MEYYVFPLGLQEMEYHGKKHLVELINATKTVTKNLLEIKGQVQYKPHLLITKCQHCN